jgi:hypothetical protein
MKNISANNKVYYIKSNLHSLGVITATTSFGNNVVLYNIERTICDIVRSRNKIDVQIFNDALRRYAVLKTADFILLGEYAKKFNVEKVLKQYMEVLL